MSVRTKRKLNWEQLDLFGDLNEQLTEGTDDGESLQPNSPSVPQGQPETVQGVHAGEETGDRERLGDGDSRPGEYGDPVFGRTGDDGDHARDPASGNNEHGETKGTGDSTTRDSLLSALESLPPRFKPSTNVLAPQGPKARAEANITSIKLLHRLNRANIDQSHNVEFCATSPQQEILARYTGWGACQEIFDESNDSFSTLRSELKELVSSEEYSAARHSTLNAHYTDPVIANAIWSALEELGLPPTATVLEPGCGTGNFIGQREGYGYVGIELDPTSAAIAQALYPDANILNKDFAEKKGGGFDAAVGNVPFGDYTVADSEFNRAGHSIHNYFIIKSLRLVKPGGLAAFVTSSYTLNSRNPAARIEMARYGEFLGAVRLPNSAHQLTAGTTVLTDIIIFRRNDEVLSATEAASQEWIQTQPIADEVRDNSYFINHPDRVVGTPSITLGRFGPTLGVEADPQISLADHLEEQLGEIVSTALMQGTSYSATQGETEAEREDHTNQRVGSIYLNNEGSFYLLHPRGRIEEFPAKGPGATELRQLLKIRDTYDKLLEEETKTHGDPDPHRIVLNEVYDAYAAKYGPINRFTLSARKQLDDDGVERMVKVYSKLGGFRKDKMFRAVAALEYFDDETGTAAKAAIFHHSVIDSNPGILGVDDPAEALAITLSRTGQVDVISVSRLLGMSESETFEQIKDLVYTDPVSGTLIDTASYLSGNVRKKLAQAREALINGDESQMRNVEALEKVLPEDLDITEIRLRLGSTWIAPEVLEQAFNSITSTYNWDKSKIAYIDALGSWEVGAPSRGQKSIAMTNEYGVPGHMDGAKILENLLNNREIQVRVLSGEKMVIDPDLTAQARDKADLLQEKMIEKIVSTPELAEQVARTYNERFNSIVPRTYNGDHLQLTSLARSFVPHAHQRQMVARILHSPTALAAHPVGAGKTAEMVIAGQILRRAGKINKPLYTVPNHMLEQFSREYLQLYPKAKILVADKDEVSPSGRAEFVSRCATEVWDAVIMSHSSFGRIPLSSDTERGFLLERHVELEIALGKYSGQASVKSVEKKITRELAKLKAKIDSISRDDAYTFEQMGVDYLFVDEAHLFKNLATISSSSELSIIGSQRATDLEMKLHYLRKSKEGEPSPRTVTFATATPVANSPTEAYVMLRYLGKDTLTNAEIKHFDDFAATFTEKVSTMELSPAGTEYRMKERIAKFRNLPELHMMFGEVMDYIPQTQIKIPVPNVRGGGITTVTIPADESLRRYTLTLGERAKAVRSRSVEPEVDNFLKITSDGRKAALDLRLVGRRYAESENAKVKTAARDIYTRHVATRENTYLDIDGTSHPRPGGLQLVFCDQSTPTGEKSSWNVYETLRDELVRMGMPERSIRFIHEAKTDDERARLFQAANSGAINVLIGSTSKMGTGVNVQNRAIAVHHLDAPWRPDELTQRIGRVVRQGNQNKEVDVVVYVNEGSFDVFLWQTLARKKNFIDQVLSSDAREVEDESSEAISYAQVKALATGNPLHIRKAELDSQILKLERRMRTFQANQSRGRNGIEACQKDLVRLEAQRESQTVLAEQWSRFTVQHAGSEDELGTSKQVYTATISAGWTVNSQVQIANFSGTSSETNKAISETLNARNQYSTMPLLLDIDGLLIGMFSLYGTALSPSYWIAYLTTPDTEPGTNPSGSQIKIELRSVREGTARITQRIFREGEEMERRVTMTEREIQKVEDKMEYFKGVVTNSVFPEMDLLLSLRNEAVSIEKILEATSQEEDELVKDLLSEDDPYVIGPEEEDEDYDELRQRHYSSSLSGTRGR